MVVTRGWRDGGRVLTRQRRVPAIVVIIPGVHMAGALAGRPRKPPFL